MPAINFLDNKKYDEQKPKDAKEKLAWSNPKKEAKNSRVSVFSFLPFTNKKEPLDKNSAFAVDKNKIKRSREEILDLIKRHENSKPLPKEKNKNFLSAIGEKLKKQPKNKEILIDYQRVFNQEKEHKSQVGKFFDAKSAIETKTKLSLAGKPEDSWFGELIKSFKNKIISLSSHKDETVKIAKFPKVEEIKPAAIKPPPVVKPISKFDEKPIEIKETKIEKKEPVEQNEIRQRVIETNLIQGEIITFFDWRSKIIILASAILIPVFVVAAIYYGLIFYQKSNQAKNLAQAEKFAELEQNIAKEEAGLAGISDFEVKLKTVSKVFEKHLYWTNFFKFLEDNTIKNVYFSNFDGDTSGSYVMEALAVDYGSISEQVDAFKNNKEVTAVEAEGGDMVSGNNKSQTLIKFVLNFTVQKNIFIE